MKIVNSTLLLLTILSGFLNEVHTLNILGIFPYEGKTHFFVFEPYIRELARRGHNVTVISHFPQKQTINNYNDISLVGETKILEDVFPIPLQRTYSTIIMVSLFLVTEGRKNCKTLMANKKVQNFWKSQPKFDVVLVEQFNSDCALGLAYKLGAPVVALTSHVLMPWQYNRYGIPYNPSFVSFQFTSGGTEPTLYQRIERTILDAYFKTLYKYMCQRVDQNTLAQYFNDIPPLEELARDVKFLLLYNNFIASGSQLFPANVIEVGGYHVAKPKPLPEDLKKFIEESKHGVIYISFGSMLQASTLPKQKLEAVIGAISQLPQRIIWKWDEKTLPGNPKNVYLSNWLPQNDILAHPNVVAFYSHCGQLGITEAIYNGVPVIGMPVFGDQPTNAALMEESGLGVQVDISNLNTEDLLAKFRTILDPDFRRKVKLISKAWHDRPLSPMDTAIFWTEYTARNRNFTFRTAAADVPLYQYLCLDVYIILIIIVVLPILAIKSIISIIFSKNKTQSSSANKNSKKSKRE